jgi:hypothetical protein
MMCCDKTQPITQVRQKNGKQAISFTFTLKSRPTLAKAKKSSLQYSSTMKLSTMILAMMVDQLEHTINLCLCKFFSLCTFISFFRCRCWCHFSLTIICCCSTGAGATRAAATAAAIVAKDGLSVKTAAAAGSVDDTFVAAVLSSSAWTLESSCTSHQNKQL